MYPVLSCLGGRRSRCLARGWSIALAVAVACATAGPAEATFPGKNGQIVYSWIDAQKDMGSHTSIRTVDPRSARVRTVRDCAELGSWADCEILAPRTSPDGTRIAFTSVDNRFLTPGPGVQRLPGVATMAADGSQYQVRVGAYDYWWLAWSPAGDRLLLERTVGPPGGSAPPALFLAFPDGAELGQATPESAHRPDWSSRGQIAFERRDQSCPFQCPNVFLMRLGSAPRQLTYRGGTSPSWSPDGRKLAFVRRNDIYLIGRSGRGLRRLTHRGGYAPAWSPDGRWIAFVRAGDMYIVRTNGRRLRRLLDEVGPDETYGLGPQVESLDWQALPGR
jgi:Tol biopolymer transport system component